MNHWNRSILSLLWIGCLLVTACTATATRPVSTLTPKVSVPDRETDTPFLTMTPEITNTETPVQPSHSTPDGASISSEPKIEQTTTPDFWQRRIPIAYNELHWKQYLLYDSILHPQVTDDTIDSIAIISDQKAWIGGFGLWKYENNQLEDFTSQGHLLALRVSKIKIAPDGKLWISYWPQSQNWVSSWDEQEDRQDYSFPGQVVDFTISKAGVVWVAYASSDTSQAGVSFYQNHAWHPVQIGDGSKKSNTIRSMFAVSDGSVWFDTKADIMFRFKENQWTQYVRKIRQSVIDEDSWSPGNFSYITEGSDGTLWGATGHIIYHYTGQSWESYYGSYPKDWGLGGVALSKDGKIWAGDGFIKDGKNYYFTNLPFYPIFAIQVAPNGSVWYGTNHGIFIYDNLE